MFHGMSSKKALRAVPVDLWRVSQRKLDMLHAAQDLIDLRVPPNNRLESLREDLEGYYSIRINVQYRLIFKWAPGSASEVQIVDYH